MKSTLALSLWLLSSIPFGRAAYKPSSSNNVAVYWGQNSAGGAKTQRPLIDICRSERNIDIILLSFLVSPTDLDRGLNFANSDRPTEQEIIECQTKHNKTLLLSLGGAATDNTWSFASPSQAAEAARRIWAAFGPPPPGPTSPSPPSGGVRPFGSAAVDGLDLDFEAPYANIQAFARELRARMDAGGAGGRRFYLSAAPQCPFPDANLAPVLQGGDGDAAAGVLDFLFVQFYNNAPCDLRTPAGFRESLRTWDAQWAGKAGDGKGRIFVGVPGAATAIGPANRASYVDGAALAAGYVDAARAFRSFAGVMVWDMSQLDGNAAFLPPIVSALGDGNGGETTTTTTTPSQTSAFISRVVPTRPASGGWYRVYGDIHRHAK